MTTCYKTSLLISFCFLTACNTTTPERYFDIAVLNSNMISGFAGEAMSRELESPSVKMDPDTKLAVPMKRVEVIEGKIRFLEEDFEKLKQLKETPDTQDMLQTSVALYQYVLPVYKNEYRQLAKLYDNGASQAQVQSMTKSINDKYNPGYMDLYKKLVSLGKLYAEKHHIKVNWQE